MNTVASTEEPAVMMSGAYWRTDRSRRKLAREAAVAAATGDESLNDAALGWLRFATTVYAVTTVVLLVIGSYLIAHKSLRGVPILIVGFLGIVWVGRSIFRLVNFRRAISRPGA
jgi:hypothetical protein